MIKILSVQTEDGVLITKYTADGVTPSHIVRELVSDSEMEVPTINPSIEEEILYETKYQTMLLEMGGM